MYFMALLPMSAMYKALFLSSGVNYDAYLAKGPLQLKVCKNVAQQHHFYVGSMCFRPLMIHNTCGGTSSDC